MKPLQIGNLTIRKPIVQGGMGVAISLSGLAAAVANEGGIGVISAAAIGMTQPGYGKNMQKANKVALAKQLDMAREKTNGVIGVNLMVALTDYDELLQLVVEKKADIAFMGAGLPLKLPQTILDAGLENIHTKFVPKVSGAKAAKLIFKYWASKYNYVPDAVVVEGPDAGGHLGFKKQEILSNDIKLADLIKETVATVEEFEQQFGKKIPVIAAGGIFDGKDMYNIMQAGASAVKLGTRFVTTHECDADIKFKERYLASKKDDIKIIESPVGLPGRVINNSFVEKIYNGETKPVQCPWKCIKTCDYKNVAYCISRVLFNSAKGKMDQGFAFAGKNAYRIDKMQSVKELMTELTTGYQQAEMQRAKWLETFKVAKVAV